MIPEGWERSTVAGVSAVPVSYGVVQTGEPVEKGVPCVRVVDIANGDLNPASMITTSQEISAAYSRTVLKEGDLMIALRGIIGQTAQATSELEGCNLTRGIARISPKKGAVTSDFLLQSLNSPEFKNLINRQANGSALQEISIATLRKAPVLLPPISEQRRIAEILKSWDRAIETVEALIANARAQKQALMQQLLPQGTTPPKKRLPGFSGDWRKLHIGDVAKEVSERAGEQTGYPVLSCSKYDGMVESLSYFKKKVYSDDTSNYKVMRRCTFGFPSNHVEEGSIGYQDLCDAGIVSPIYCVFATSNEVDDGFLYKLLKTDRYRQIFAAATNASVDRRGSLRWKEFSRIPLPLPPLEEQRAISEAVNAVASTEAAYQAQLTALRQEKAALMQQLLTGKRRVKLPESEVA